ncbi:MAG: uracil-DNA glycosylase [Acidimicrobiia bacterium]|nr:uracil-DNA glycosylase [Acidimicrobiia bacterium]
MTLDDLAARIAGCRQCPRLVVWREEVGVTKRAAFRDEDYWARPVPGFGDPEATVLVVGLAPAAHGANRTGRMFTGDRSGDWLYRAMFRAGFASQPTSQHRGDGLSLTGAYVTAAVRCAPPANKPAAEEKTNCAPWLDAELELLKSMSVIVALGNIGYTATMQAMTRRGVEVPRPRPRFAHGGEVRLDGLTVLSSYHPSQQNTFTGRLTEPMFDAVFSRARELSRSPSGGSD